jgi:type IX secretion system PorP/SprF family membrane protein
MVNIFTMQAQNVHFNQINNASTFLNPAQAGLINEKYRLSIINRSQYLAVAPYKTNYFSFDTKIKANYNQFMGGGFILYRDVSGDGNFTSSLIQLPFSHTTRFDNDKVSYLSFGAAAGVNLNSINFNKFYFEKQYNNNDFDKGLASGETLNNSNYVYSNFAAGCNYVFLLNNYENIALGASVRYFTKPRRVYIKNQSQFSTQLTVNYTYQKMLNDNFRFLYQGYFSLQKKFNETVNAFTFEYQLLGGDIDKKIIVGVQNRWNDSFTLTSGYNYNKLTAMLSYDIMYSSYRKATRMSGAVEVGLRYVFTTKSETNTTTSKKHFVFL